MKNTTKISTGENGDVNPQRPDTPDVKPQPREPEIKKPHNPEVPEQPETPGIDKPKGPEIEPGKTKEPEVPDPAPKEPDE